MALNKVYVFRYISNPLSIVFGSPVHDTQSASPSSIPIAGNLPYFLLFFQATKVGEAPDKLFKIKKHTNVYKNQCTQKHLMKNSMQHTNISSAILSLTSSFIFFQLFTPMSGAHFLVNITISSTNARLFGPIGPPRVAENSVESFSLRSLTLLLTTVSPLTVPRPFFFG